MVIGMQRKLSTYLQFCLLTMFLAGAMSCACHAQSWSWASTGQTSGFSVGHGVATDAWGNVFTTGSFENTIDFGSGNTLVSSGAEDVFLAKHDAGGRIVWAISAGKSANDEGKDIALDGNGDVYLTGVFTDSIRFQAGVGSHVVNGFGGMDIFIAKIDGVTGDAIWVDAAGGTAEDQGLGITVMGTDVYISGSITGLASFPPFPAVSGTGGLDIFCARYDQASNDWVWALPGGTTFDDAGTAITNDGSAIYLTGYAGDGGFNFGTNNFANIGNDDAFVTRLTPLGATVWTSWAGSPVGSEHSYGIATDGVQVYTTGTVAGLTSMGFYANPTLTVGSAAPNGNFWLAAMRVSDGETQWARIEGGAGHG